MTRAAQLASLALAIFLGLVGLMYLFAPAFIGERIGGSVPSSNFEIAGLRAQAGSMLALAIMAGIGARTQKWTYLLPTALTFLFIIIARVFSLVADGAGDGSYRSLVLAIIVFVVAEFALQVFRRSERATAEA